MVTIISFVIVLGILVFIHEFGHYWFARRNGIVVEEFGMGYPPRLVKLFTYDGTDFTINWIPFGGFARMKGEDAGDMSPGSFNAATKGGRAITLLAGPAMNALLAIILFAASFLMGFPAAAAHPQIASDVDTALIQPYGLQAGDILLRFNDLPVLVSAFPEMPYQIRSDLAPSAENAEASDSENLLIVSRDGQLIKIALPNPDALDNILASIKNVPVLTTQIIGIADESPALAAGLTEGDLVYEVDDVLITEKNPLNKVITERAGQEVTITLLRGESWEQVPIVPRKNPPDNQGALGIVISPIRQLATLSVVDAVIEGTRSTFQYFGLVLQLPYLLLSGQNVGSDTDMLGPVGIAKLVGNAASATIETGLLFPILRLSAVLSAALAVTNMLPLPALDGGRLFFILIETVRGRRISPEREGMVHMVGFVLLLGLLVLITVRDISTTRQGIDWIQILGQ
ncbi:RIP metalloprotease RseP [Chloroflexi bacterium TSY]|nr:RIP metalloprotease RseP [Chloroflexi bacterium TSY]